MFKPKDYVTRIVFKADRVLAFVVAVCSYCTLISVDELFKSNEKKSDGRFMRYCKMMGRSFTDAAISAIISMIIAWLWSTDNTDITVYEKEDGEE